MPLPRPMPLRVLTLEGTPRACGEAHGEAFRDAIRDYAEDRVSLACDGSWTGGLRKSRESVLALASQMIPAQTGYAPHVQEELDGLARSAGISREEALIVSGFTDFVDAVRAMGDAPQTDGCTSVLVPSHRGGGRSWYAQTWDMHGTATEFVVVLDHRPAEGPRSWIFTTVGCVGQIGLNEAGISLGIDNLTCTDGSVGVCWPHVVRRVLAEATWEGALAAIRTAPVAGGHAYHLLDGQGRGVMIERSSTRHAEWPLDRDVLTHTNHALDPGVQEVEAQRLPAAVRSSRDRLLRAQTLVAEGDFDLAALVALTRDGTICRRAILPHDIETSGAVVIEPASRSLWAVWGDPRDGRFEPFDFGSSSLR